MNYVWLVESISDFSLFQESRFMKTLLLSSELDLRHTARGKFKHFPRCILFPGAVNFLHFQLHFMNVTTSDSSWFCWCRSRLWVIQILFHRSKIIRTNHDRINVEMIAYPDQDCCQSSLPSALYCVLRSCKSDIKKYFLRIHWFVQFLSFLSKIEAYVTQQTC